MGAKQEWMVPLIKPGLVAALIRNKGNITHMALELGANVKSLYNWLEKCGVDPAEYRRVCNGKRRASVRKADLDWEAAVPVGEATFVVPMKR